MEPDVAEPVSGSGYERGDLPLRGVVFFAAGLAVAGVLIPLLVVGMFTLFAGQATRRDVRTRPPSERTTEPTAAPIPWEELQRRRAEQEARLRSYGWVDRDAGIFHIPIDRAIDQVAQEGR